MAREMQHARHNPVTDIPVLTPCPANKQEGVASFLPKPTPVRRLTVDELEPKMLKGLLKELSANDRQHLFGVLDLISAVDAKDSLALQKAAKRIHSSRAPMHKLMRRLLGVPPERMKVVEDLQLALAGMKAERFPHEELSRAVSYSLSKCSLVLWWTGKRFLPALFCPDTETGLYVLVLLAKVRGKALTICPKCGQPFVRKRNNQSYCSTKHREAHRMARWRAVKAQKKKLRGEKGRTREKKRH